MAGVAGFRGFARHAMAALSRVPARHDELLIDRLSDVAEGGCDRLMVQMPPGSAKSTYGSILFPAWFLGRYPRSQILATAHTASLAGHFGRYARQAITEHEDVLGISIAKDSKGAARFSTTAGGEYFSAGVRGPITGRRADLIIIDDPIKSWAEAESELSRNMLYNWYRAELSARLKPRGRVVLIMTRWHEDDLAGRLLASEPGWTCLKLPAIAGKDDALGRVEGEVLWPEWQDEAAVLRTRREVGEKMFAALYQQAPRPSEAAYFNTHTIKVLAEAPEFARTIRAWDLAATLPGAGRNPDYTVGLKLGMAADGRLIVADVVRFQGTPAQVEAKIQEVARRDGAGTVQALPQDPGQAGAAQIATLTRGLGGLRVVAGPEMGAKVNRAMPAATQIDAGMLAIVDAPWNDVFLQELSAFPSAAKDDQVDALSRAVNVMMTTVGQAARRVAVPLLGR